MKLSQSLIKTATKLIKQFGQSVTLVTRTDGEYNPDTGESYSEVESSVFTFLDVYKTADYSDFIVMGDVPAYFTVNITNKDHVKIDGKEYAVTMVSKYSLSGESVLNVANLRAL